MKRRITAATIETLHTQLKAQSINKHSFPDAAEEWHFVDYYTDNTGDSLCACGQTGMKHVYVIKNMQNDNKLTVGIRCAQQIFTSKFGALMIYIKRTKETRSWVFTRGMIRYALMEGWIDTDEAFFMEQYITQKSRPSGKAIHDRVCQSTRKCLDYLREQVGVDKLAIDRILGNMPA